MSEHTHDIQKEMKKYLAVFGGLLVLTVITVSLSYVPTVVTVGIILARIVAAIKSSLVACHFMHLTSEKRSVYLVLVLAAVFFAAMMALICIAYFNVPEGVQHVS